MIELHKLNIRERKYVMKLATETSSLLKKQCVLFEPAVFNDRSGEKRTSWSWAFTGTPVVAHWGIWTKLRWNSMWRWGRKSPPTSWHRLPFGSRNSVAGWHSGYPLVMTNIANWKMTIEIVDFPIENGDFPWIYQRVHGFTTMYQNLHMFFSGQFSCRWWMIMDWCVCASGCSWLFPMVRQTQCPWTMSGNDVEKLDVSWSGLDSLRASRTQRWQWKTTSKWRFWMGIEVEQFPLPHCVTSW